MDNTAENSGSSAAKIVRMVICIIFCIMAVLPFYILIINSTLRHADIASGIKFIPGTHFIENFKNLFDPNHQIVSTFTLFEAFRNSIIITVPATILQIYFGSLTAYALTVYNFKGRDFAWGLIYGIMMIPTQVSIVGLIKVTKVTHMFGTFWPMILPAIAAPTTVYFMKQYMENGLSIEVVEAARIDGCSEFKIFNQIALPLMKPAMATQAIFAFVASWNNLYTPSILLGSNRQLSTLPMYAEAIRANDKRQDFGQVYTALLCAILPILIAYFALSKYIIAGVALGGVKE
ncbi:MAG: carbohydrate ABC transporter permease [Clostridium sp.]|nr:carbohydrate ABC transporter permease [Clostridium sp.]